MITFRPATPDDASFIARHVLEALHWGMYELPLTEEKVRAWEELTEVCRLPETLYSAENATLALVDGEPAGLLVAYDGGRYREFRANTFPRLSAFADKDVDIMPDESQEGEYYIDSLAVAPQHRGKGLGRSLLLEAVKQAQIAGLRATLLVDPDNPPALRLYSSVGFKDEGQLWAFGQWYRKLEIRF